MSSLSRLAATALGLFAVAMACTNDYDEFQFTGSPDAAGGTNASGGTTSGSGGQGGSGNLGALGGSSGTGGGTGGTTGGAGGSTGGVGGGTGGTGVTCAAGEKFCSTTSTCVPDNDPATNCASADCTPCDLAHATEQCATTGECAILACDPGFNNCDRLANTGCEQTFDDPANCGACGRVCSTANSIAQDCTITSGLSSCVHTCATGFSDCIKQSAPSADDGCETNTSTSATRCGSCNNACRGSLVCLSSLCECSADANCSNGSATGTCSNSVCVCGGTTCVIGEICARSGSNTVCQCNGGARCTGTGRRACCQSGCVDIDSDESNCGACGRACGTGQTCCGGSCVDTSTDTGNCGGCGTACVTGLSCAGGLCVCTSDAACDGGTPGTCSGGLCTCGDGGAQCAQNQRCDGSGACGT